MSQYISPELRRQVLELDDYRCAYCLSPEFLSGIPLTIDHIVPVAAGGETTLENLCAACRPCNEFKAAKTTGPDPDSGEIFSLYHPRTHTWRDHFGWDDTGTLVIGKTGIGRATVSTLNMNHFLIVDARARWVSVGWHPPQS